MHIEIHKPELQILIRKAIADGRFPDVEEAMLHALKAASPQPAPPKNAPMRMGSELIAAMQAMPYKDIDIEPERPHMPVRTLEEVFAKVRALPTISIFPVTRRRGALSIFLEQ